MEEKIIDIVRSYKTGEDGSSMVVTIPKEVRNQLEIEHHDKFHVKTDSDGRVIYERL